MDLDRDVAPTWYHMAFIGSHLGSNQKVGHRVCIPVHVYMWVCMWVCWVHAKEMCKENAGFLKPTFFCFCFFMLTKGCIEIKYSPQKFDDAKP